MNSKSEYNRCKVPRICTKSEKEVLKENEKEDEVEKALKNEIKVLKKCNGKKRGKMKNEIENVNDNDKESGILGASKRLKLQSDECNVINENMKRMMMIMNLKGGEMKKMKKM